MSAAEINNALMAIDQQTEDMDENDVEEISLDQIRFERITPEIKEKLETYTNLASLTLNDCNLTSLDNFPELPNLIRLEIQDNNLPHDVLMNTISKFTELQSLSIGGNQIKEFEHIESLKKLTKLFQLDLENCPICQQTNYRNKIFEMLSSTLGILDNKDKNGEEVAYDEEEEESNEDDEDGDESNEDADQENDGEDRQDDEDEDLDDDEDQESIESDSDEELDQAQNVLGDDDDEDEAGGEQGEEEDDELEEGVEGEEDEEEEDLNIQDDDEEDEEEDDKLKKKQKFS